MCRIRIALLMVALVAALGVALFMEAAVQAAPLDTPAAYDKAYSLDIVAMQGSVNVYVSEDTLWREFYHAADYHDARIASKLLRVINMRHEYRVHLPR